MAHLAPSAAPRPPRARTTLLASCTAAALLSSTAVAQAEVYVGTPGPDTMRSKHDTGDTLWGGGGADTLTGGAGPDSLYGVRSDNAIDGRGGDDYIEGGAGSDVIEGGTGNNTIFGSSGQDRISTGNGNNYVDVGGGNDQVSIGNGNNVLHTGSGGGRFRLGNGNNTVYYGSGIVYITAGSGVNHFYLSGVQAVRELNCGGNPQTVIHVNSAALKGRPYALQVFKRNTTGCDTIVEYDGHKRIQAKIAGLWDVFDLKGADGRDKLFGGHGGGTIDAGEGDNEVWADHNEDTGLPRSKGYTTTIAVGNGNNKVFGGRGTNVITAGNGNNFIRAGMYVNTIRVGSGTNLVRLQGNVGGSNDITIDGTSPTSTGTFVESLANGRKPMINCINGAQASIVYGNTKPQSNCKPMYSARSPKGKKLQVLLTPGVHASDPIYEAQIEPGEMGIGVPRPGASS